MKLLTSPKLAIALLVGVLGCCLVGVTVFRGAQAWQLIFSTLWFNALLALLAVSSGAAFFGRIWRRRLTLVSVGMILFHLSFMSVLGGIIFNSLTYFRGVLRLTEGETLPNGLPESYDTAEHGRFFDYARLRGETTLVRMHTGYKVEGNDKRAAYEIAVGDGSAKQQEIIYITRHLDHEGIRYFCSKEGYSILVDLAGKDGQVRYAAVLPLQSLKQADGTYLYSTGTATEPGAFSFPAAPANPVMALQLTYHPDPQVERGGIVQFQSRPLSASSAEEAGPGSVLSGQAAIGGAFTAGDYTLSPAEVRYWVGMSVRYDPGVNLVLASLSTGLVGMVLTFIGRLRQGSRKRAALTA